MTSAIFTSLSREDNVLIWSSYDSSRAVAYIACGPIVVVVVVVEVQQTHKYLKIKFVHSRTKDTHTADNNKGCVLLYHHRAANERRVIDLYNQPGVYVFVWYVKHAPDALLHSSHHHTQTMGVAAHVGPQRPVYVPASSWSSESWSAPCTLPHVGWPTHNAHNPRGQMITNPFPPPPPSHAINIPHSKFYGN